VDSYKKWQMQCLAEEAVDILTKSHYDACYAENLEEALKIVTGMIPEGSSVALGGSQTLSEMGILDVLRRGNYKLFDRYQDLPHEEIVEIMRQSLLSDFLITGTNAITRNGELVNMDCSGNRVAGMIFGPKRVIVVAGANKLVENVDDAVKRIRTIAPLNSKRIKHETPCTKTGKCMDCHDKKRICNYLTVINNGWKFEGRISVIVIADEVGF
jgi:L-lactate utilization protein LutB